MPATLMLHLHACTAVETTCTIYLAALQQLLQEEWHSTLEMTGTMGTILPSFLTVAMSTGSRVCGAMKYKQMSTRVSVKDDIGTCLVGVCTQQKLHHSCWELQEVLEPGHHQGSSHVTGWLSCCVLCAPAPGPTKRISESTQCLSSVPCMVWSPWQVVSSSQGQRFTLVRRVTRCR